MTDPETLKTPLSEDTLYFVTDAVMEIWRWEKGDELVPAEGSEMGVVEKPTRRRKAKEE